MRLGNFFPLNGIFESWTIGTRNSREGDLLYKFPKFSLIRCYTVFPARTLSLALNLSFSSTLACPRTSFHTQIKRLQSPLNSLHQQSEHQWPNPCNCFVQWSEGDLHTHRFLFLISTFRIVEEECILNSTFPLLIQVGKT